MLWGRVRQYYPPSVQLMLMDHSGRSCFVQVSGGAYEGNEAIFGGFISTSGSGNTTCSGASIKKNRGLNGGAIYAVDATLDWVCGLAENEAITGSAMWVAANDPIGSCGSSPRCRNLCS